MNLGFIGLGTVGACIAKALLRRGYELTVFNRTVSKAKKFAKKHYCNFVYSIEELCCAEKIIFICVDAEESVKQISSEIKKHLRPKSIVIDHSTINFEIAKRLHADFKKHKIGFLDAPVTGGEEGAGKQIGGVMVGGDRKTFKAVEEIIRSYSKTVEYMGPSGQGQLTKIANQICSINTKQGIFEALDFANRCKLDRQKLTKILLSGSAQSLQLRKNKKLIQKKVFERLRPHARKEIGITIKNANKKKIRLLCTEEIAKIIKI